jgi:hypothetical protein
VVLGIDFAGRTHQQTTSLKRRQWRVLVVSGVVSAVKMGFVIVSSCILLLGHGELLCFNNFLHMFAQRTVEVIKTQYYTYVESSLPSSIRQIVYNHFYLSDFYGTAIIAGFTPAYYCTRASLLVQFAQGPRQLVQLTLCK